MTIICIQAELGINSKFSEELLSNSLFALGYEFELKTDGKELNYYLQVDDVDVAWKQIKAKVIQVPEIGSSCDVICQGSLGWDNVMFLHQSEQ